MNRSELRIKTAELIEKAKTATGQPKAEDLALARDLFNARDSLSNQISSNVKVKYPQEKSDLSTWAGIETYFTAYYAALVELENKLAIPMAQVRLRGI